MMPHFVPATPQTTRIGQFDATFPPVASIAAGESVTLQCVSGFGDAVPGEGSGMTVPQALRDIAAANTAGLTGHIITCLLYTSDAADE